MLIKLFYFLQTKTKNIKKTIQGKHPSRLGSVKLANLFILELATLTVKYLLILFKNPTQSFKVLVNQPALSVCRYSYCDHKTFQKKVRVFSLAGLAVLISATVISSLILNLTTGPIFQSRAATYNWIQTSWLGGETANNASHASNQTGWTQYSDKDDNIAAATELAISTQTNSWTVTDNGSTDTGFNNSGASKSGTGVSGSGSAAGVVLASSNPVSWTKYASNPVLNLGTGGSWDGSHVYVSSIILDGGTYKMWYTGDDGINNRIGYATSSDGITWTKYASNPVLDLGTNGSWDDASVYHPSVIIDDGTYKMWYTGNDGVNIRAGYATSSDGITWTKYASNPVLNLGTNGSWDDVYIHDVSVILDGATYKMWYSGHDGITWRIGYATSSDGITWTKYASNPVLDLGTGGSWDDVFVYAGSIVIDGSTYKMWYSGHDGSDWRIGYATSSDGITWTKSGSNPILNLGSNETWDDVDVYGSAVLVDGTSYKMWYNGGDGANNRIGYATANYESSGTFTSHAFDTTANVSFGNLSWTATTPAGTSLTIKARSGNQSNLSDATAWGSCSNITSGQALSTGSCVTNTHRYIQFQASFSTTDVTATATLSDITAQYTNYPSSQTLTSSSYNTSSSGNLLSSLSWNEDTSLPSGTTVQLQLRTAPNSSNSPGTWTSFLGPDGTTGTYFSNSGTGCTKASTTVTCTTIPSAFTGGSNDQWISYKVYLGSSGANTPTFSDVTMQYVVNAPPDFDTSFNTTGVTATQNSDGTVTIQYRVRDSDTTSGTITQGYITPSFEYSTNDGGSYTAITTTYLASTDLENKAVQEGTYTTYSATWSPKSQINGNYTTTAKIRVTVNDNEAANNTANAASAAFTLDTTNPAAGSPYLSINPASARPGTATLTISATDNSSIQMKVGLASDLSDASWETYSTSKTITLVTDPETVYIQFKDAYSNTGSIISSTTPAVPDDIMIQDTSNLRSTPASYRLFVAWETISTPDPGFKQYNVFRSTDNTTFTQIATVSDSINTNYYSDTTAVYNQTYYYKVTSQDDNDNISYYSDTIEARADGIQNLGEGGGGNDGVVPTISSVTSSNIQTTQATINWTTDELANSTVGYSMDTSFSMEHSVASYATSHSVTLTNLTPDTTYYFQIKSADPSSNQAIDNNSGSGYTFTTLSGPRISNVDAEVISNTSARIVWYSDADSNSYVVYSSSSNLSNSTETGSTSLAGGSGPNYYHSVTLSSLAQGTTYYYYVKSTDSDGNIAIDNNGASYYTFKTTQDSTSPTLSSITVSTTTPDTVIITWTTNEPSTSQIEYGTTTSYGTSTTEDTDLVLTHIVSITNLTPSTDYNFKVVSQDSSGNDSSSSNQTFTTLEEGSIRVDQISPVLSDIDVESITSSGATITFTSSESCVGTIDYGTTTSYGGTVGGSGSSNVTSHTIVLTGLSAATTYNFKINCEDGSNNIGSSDNQSFTTLTQSSSGDSTSPTISNVKASGIASSAVTITFITNELCLGSVNYGTSTSYSKGVTELSSSTSHSVELNNLFASTDYHFQAKCTDSANNVGSSEDGTFTTLAPTSTVGGKTEVENRVEGLIGDKFSPEDIRNAVKRLQSPPSISGTGPKTSEISSVSLKVSWSTDKKSNGVVVYSTSELLLKSQEGSTKIQGVLEVGNTEEQSLGHEVALANLVPGTTYYYKVKSQDIYGNTTVSDIQSFNTSVIPIISDVQISSVTLTSAVISWSTSVIATGYVEYGKDTNYGSVKEHDDSTAKSTSHTIILTSLSPTTIYHFRIKGVSQTDSSLISSEDYMFNTQALPEIKSEEIKKITDNSAKINFETNIETDTQIFYKPLNSQESYEQKGKSDFVKKHEILLESLDFGTQYDILIKVKDAYDNTAEKQLPTFTTGIDLDPPQVSLLRAENALIPGKKDKVQTIISWKTDEPSTTQLAYQEGIDTSKSELKEKTPEDKILTKDHILVLTSLKPGTVYQLKAISKDNQGNVGMSKNQTMLTPRQQESVFQVIIKNLEDAFGWVKMIR